MVFARAFAFAYLRSSPCIGKTCGLPDSRLEGGE
jgi:hypothetical protein